MSLKEFGKEVAVSGLTALLLSPTVLLILLILFIVLAIVATAIIIYYGLVTAITLFILGVVAVLTLHYTKAVDLEKQPLIATLPFILAIIGYVGERIRLFAVQPLWTATPTPTHPTQTWLIIIILLIIMAAALATRGKK